MTAAELIDAFTKTGRKTNGRHEAECPVCLQGLTAKVREVDGLATVTCSTGCTAAAILAALDVDPPPPEGPPQPEPAPAPKPRRERQERGEAAALQLIELAAGLELFGDAQGEAYCMLPLPTTGRRAVRLKSSDFKSWLSRRFYEHSSGTRAANAEALSTALGVLSARALHDGGRADVAVRVAEHGGDLYLDLANTAGEAVVLTTDGWFVTPDHPVRFRTSRGMLPLPAPEPGGSLEELRPLINAPGDAEWRLLVSWLVAAMRPGRPLPVLVLQGEAGSAKSTAGRLLRGLVDPARPADRSKPRDERDLAIAARNGWIVSFDNLSGLSDSLSDALCRLSTGAGFATRELHTDVDEVLIDVLRPVVLNGIDDLLHRGDLTDRALRVELPVIPEGRRRTDAEVRALYDLARPRILGALCEAVCGALKALPTISEPNLPRMADYATWVVAAESELGWPKGSALAAYRGNRAGLVEAALEGDPVASMLRRLLRNCEGGTWCGTVGELLGALSAMHSERPPVGWPQSARKLSDRLRRAAPHLRAVGVEIEGPTRTNAGAVYTVRGKTVTTVTTVTAQRENHDNADPARPSPTVTTVIDPHRPSPRHSGRRDERDEGDGLSVALRRRYVGAGVWADDLADGELFDAEPITADPHTSSTTDAEPTP